MSDLLSNVRTGFKKLNVEEKYKKAAIDNIKEWLEKDTYKEYLPQIKHIIKNQEWDYLLDCFYQIIPFGTGGRRGEVGIGPNRINKWTIKASAQGHSQYLIKKYGNDAKKRGVVLAFDVRVFYTNKYFNDSLPNPVRNLSCLDLANAAAEVYTANGIHVHIFDDVRTTPELSFAIRYLKAVAGDMFSASHNPPEHNGKKVYDEFGGQLIPPHDEELVEEVTDNVKDIKVLNYKDADKKGLINLIGKEVDNAYIEAVNKLSLSDKRDIKIVFTPLHGTGSTSVEKCLKKLGFDVNADPKTSYASGKFENVTFNIPNPEVIQSFDTTLKYAKKINGEIILNCDPDADRIGVMIKHGNEWKYLNGNEIGSILLNYVIEKKKSKLKGKGIVIKTSVTTNLAREICNANDVEIKGDLPVGFKYIGDLMNKLEDEGKIDNFLFGLEESHGYIAGNYVRDKDAAVAGLWLSELSAELKENGKTLWDYLNETYSKYGYFRNYLTEIRLPGAEGMSKINKIQETMRGSKLKTFGKYKVNSIEDFRDRKPIVSETDRLSKNVLVFHLEPFDKFTSLKVTLRPSGTEPKIKMYFELGTQPCKLNDLENIKNYAENELKLLEKDFMLHCYKILGIDFPERGFLLFWQLPLKDKLRYFEIEGELIKLKDIQDIQKRKKETLLKLEFLGSDPIKKVDNAFKKKFGKGIEDYLDIS
ncbi:phospho-sugar mutase [Candidatus Woesebacteria bacterium]|nr:phospho-sugar mutase [Candidatus Woesebacteria bacterium]